MVRKYFFLTIIVLVLLSSPLVGCSSAQIEPNITQVEPAPTQIELTLTFTPLETTLSPVEPSPIPSEPTPIPEPKIVWSDDFEDGDTDGWTEVNWIREGQYFLVKEGIPTFGVDGGLVWHDSPVSVGTWSLDIFIPDVDFLIIDFVFLSAELDTESNERAAIVMRITKADFMFISLIHHAGDGTPDNVVNGRQIFQEEKLFGWHHFDITRSESGNVKIYMDGELHNGIIVDFPYQPDNVFFMTALEGPAFDNVVVYDKVIDIQQSD